MGSLLVSTYYLGRVELLVLFAAAIGVLLVIYKAYFPSNPQEDPNCASYSMHKGNSMQQYEVSDAASVTMSSSTDSFFDSSISSFDYDRSNCPSEETDSLLGPRIQGYSSQSGVSVVVEKP
ncbi:hypothetical protein K493DRAFT_311662 [Basidiobolus meristosporus CBS 931.73]|uniref:Uncharacterized protein n=1 Tax=Basidiobolus meristosporus CBS 931.73 TaxID=1314790 RepID=A0A1Y1Z116_9FUNG|nr:hypothetical protein K493DRAFT_311662 [Basidiobolus meristosporus CBS 931.73]|eukprot:ORY03637.1 hypothetical protein K493DRAFT_311662 [Basidiobolus meristosporus CBS 931.73]